MKTNIIYNNIVKESEKAICLNVPVSYASNAPKGRDIWMPKSVCSIFSERVAVVEDWFIDKLRNQNAFHGYRMNFETI